MDCIDTKKKERLTIEIPCLIISGYGRSQTINTAEPKNKIDDKNLRTRILPNTLLLSDPGSDKILVVVICKPKSAKTPKNCKKAIIVV